MKRILFSIFILLLACKVFPQPKIITPNVKSATSFAVFIDSESYDALKSKVQAYKDAVEKDGLATYVLVDHWASPETVKEQITALYNSKMPLEGVVFMGDIPIAMIRDAQHLTSAFKMNQTADWKDSSIPSDRFYDDFDLKFNFIKQDSDVVSYFYYSLDKDSKQHIGSDIYSARVRPVGENRIEKLALFLDKAVAAHAQANVLDNMFVFRGHGYNSEAKDAWSGEQVSLHEQLPSLFYGKSRIRFYDFETAFPMKNYLLEQLRVDDMDVALCHHHGAEDMQYLNGYQSVSGVQQSAENIKRYLRSKVVGKKDQEENLKQYMEYMDVSASWIDLSDSMKAADEEYDRMMDIYLEDIYAAKPNSRFVMFDACYNGSFHMDDCIANAYIFSDGKTIITQGNTVNSLQDRWPDRYIGLFAYGIRIGEWGRHQQVTLETHMVGDPTYRFSNTADNSLDINALVTTKQNDAKTWLKMLDNNSADVQAMALRKLNDMGYNDIENLLVDKFNNSHYGSVRLEALTLMTMKHSPLFVDMLIKGINDNYELIRRLSANYIGECGDPRLAPALANAIIEDKLSKRMAYHCSDDVRFFEPAVLKAAMKEAFASHGNLMNHTGEGYDYYADYVDNAAKSVKSDFDEVILNKELTVKKRNSEITYYRNYTHHYMIPSLIAFAQDKSQDEELRVSAVEALGWFSLSYRAADIDAMCDRLISSDSSKRVVDECWKTKNRLAKQ